MKGDFTRSTFRARKHYRRVLTQQGRVQLDADWNEQVDITTHRIDAGTADVIGPCGAPLDQAGFAITDGPTPRITGGRYYVDGILCENEDEIDLAAQPDLPGFVLPAAPEAGTDLYLVYLDAWERHITALDDPVIREVALGGPDTATRSQTVWQVRLLGPVAGPLNCLSEPEGWADIVDGRENIMLNARATESAGDEGPCVVPPGSGYRRLENQLYRVEAHQGGTAGAGATFKWSRDNGSIVTRWQDKVGDDLIVDSIGRDEVLRFATGQWVELIDSARELNGLPGTLAQLLKVEGGMGVGGAGAALTIDPMTATGPVELADFGPDRRIRRWDHAATATSILLNGAVPISEGTAEGDWISLEDGVQVQFQPGGNYRTGDYWIIPARTNSADIEWPRDPNDETITVPQGRAGIHHHICKLGILARDAAGFQFTDCRPLFPPLTRLTALHYAGGDGQEAAPGALLPALIQVRVLNGQAPVVGAPVQFAVLEGGGTLQGSQPALTTGPDGIAAAQWRLGALGPQRVEVALLDAAGNPAPGQRIQFAALAVVDQGGGGCCVCVGEGGDYDTLAAALTDLLAQGRRDICICLLPGRHRVAVEPIQGEFGENALHIKITGCGHNTRLRLERPLEFQNVSSVVLRDLALETDFPTNPELMAIDFNACDEILIENCRVLGVTEGGALLRIVDGDNARITASHFEATLPSGFVTFSQTLERLAEAPGGDLIAGLFRPQRVVEGDEAFRSFAMEAALNLSRLSLEERQRLAAAIQSVAGERSAASPTVFINLAKLIFELRVENPLPASLWEVLLDILEAVKKTFPGNAIILGPTRLLNEILLGQLGDVIPHLDNDDLTLVEGNEIIGALSLYGEPTQTPNFPDVFNADTIGALVNLVRQQALSFSNGFLGALQVRGNQIVRVTIAEQLLRALAAIVGAENRQFLFDLFGRQMWTENVIEGGLHTLLGQHLTLSGNEFTGSAAPTGRQPGPVGGPAGGILVFALGERAIYLANRSGLQTIVSSATQQTDQAINQGVTIQP